MLADEGAAPQNDGDRKRRRRRSSREVLDNILAAASEEFETHGYAGATTSAIARRANVSEPLIFSNFGSKAELFHASIFEPMNRHLMAFNASHLSDPGKTGEDKDRLRRAYIGELEAFIDRHSRKLVSLFFTQTYGADTHSLDDIEGIQDYFDKASAITRKPSTKPRIDPDVLSRISFIAIFSTIVFKDWLFAKHDISKEALFASLTDFIVEGLSANDR